MAEVDHRMNIDKTGNDIIVIGRYRHVRGMGGNFRTSLAWCRADHILGLPSIGPMTAQV